MGSVLGYSTKTTEKVKGKLNNYLKVQMNH